MSVGLETDENIDVSEIVRAWPANLASELDVRLLTRLSEALEQALDDAVALGLEVADEFSATDSDVPSVADHAQNSYRHGFLPMVRVIADVWTQLARKDPEAALRLVQRWTDSPHKLDRRLALFAAADPSVPSDMVSMILARVSIAQHFNSNTTVELFRLLRARWRGLPEAARRAEERIFVGGPEIGGPREGVDVARLVDRARYEAIGVVRDLGEHLAPATVGTFDDIQRRYPEWLPRPAEETGFHVWMGDVTQVGPADPQVLGGVADEDLVATAQRLDANAPFGDGNHWSTLCGRDPERALRGLIAEANAGRWSPAAWRAPLWSRAVPSNPGFAVAMANALIECPADVFSEILGALANWLVTPPARALDTIFWRLWDRILANLSEEANDHDPARYFDRAINTPVGNLAEAILKNLPSADADGAFARVIEPRLDAVCALPGHNGVLARVRLAADLAFLHARAPAWTTARLVPSFAWTDPMALAMWSARVYSSVVGSPALFALTKEPLLELFGRADVPSKLKEDYADWLLIPLFSDQAHDAGYPLTFVEARTALRRIGPGALWQIGHRFAIEMEAAMPDEKVRVWRDIVGPVFRGTWPLDAELRTSRANFKLVQMLRASGQAFPEAVDDVIPFLARDSGQGHLTTIHSLGDADAELYELAPRKLLDLVNAIVGDSDSGSVYGLKKVLDRIVEAEATVVGLARYQRLRQLASRDG